MIIEKTNAICRYCGGKFYVDPMESEKGKTECPYCGEKENLVLPPQEMRD